MWKGILKNRVFAQQLAILSREFQDQANSREPSRLRSWELKCFEIFLEAPEIDHGTFGTYLMLPPKYWLRWFPENFHDDSVNIYLTVFEREHHLSEKYIDVTFSTATLLHEDPLCLRPGGLLNSTIMNCYMKMCQKQRLIKSTCIINAYMWPELRKSKGRGVAAVKRLVCAFLVRDQKIGSEGHWPW